MIFGGRWCTLVDEMGGVGSLGLAISSLSSRMLGGLTSD